MCKYGTWDFQSAIEILHTSIKSVLVYKYQIKFSLPSILTYLLDKSVISVHLLSSQSINAKVNDKLYSYVTQEKYKFLEIIVIIPLLLNN